MARARTVKDQIHAQSERERVARERRQIAALRSEVRTLRALRRAAVEEATTTCRAERAAAKVKCDAKKADARGALEAVREKRGALFDAEAWHKNMKRAVRHSRERTRERTSSRRFRGTRREKRQESDADVLANLPPELHALFQRVAPSIKATSRSDRTEVFLKYAEEHPREVFAAIEEDGTDAAIAEMMRRDAEEAARYERRANPARRAKKKPPPASKKAEREYERTHWGERGPRASHVSSVPNVAAGELVELGQLVSVVYATKKRGDRELTEYEHDFGSRGRPTLAYNRTGLFVAGGGYRVTERGIVG